MQRIVNKKKEVLLHIIINPVFLKFLFKLRQRKCIFFRIKERNIQRTHAYTFYVFFLLHVKIVQALLCISLFNLSRNKQTRD